MNTVHVKLPEFIAKNDGLLTRDFVGEILRISESGKGLLLRAHADLSPTDYCHRCGRKITHPVSLQLGFGPDCCEYLGISRQELTQDKLDELRQRMAATTEIERWFPVKYAYDEDGEPFRLPDDWHPPTREDKINRITVTEDGFNLLVNWGYDAELVALFKEILPRGQRSWDKNRKAWVVPKLSARYVVDFYRAATGKLPEGAWAEKVMNIHEEIEETKLASRAADADIEVPGLNPELSLFPYQKAGVAYVQKHPHTYIADEMGLGKTVQALASAKLLDAFPFVVIPPASLKINWKREAEKWLPGHTVQILSGAKPKPGFKWEKPGRGLIVVVNYDILHGWVDKLIELKPKGIAPDEAHYVKNKSAKRSQALAKLIKTVQPEMLTFLTGTPIKNRPEELVFPLTLLGAMEIFKSEWEFMRTYVWRGNQSAWLDLNEKLRSFCYIRREKQDIFKELPDKRRLVVTFDITNRAEYQRAEENIISYLMTEAEVERRFLESIRDLPNPVRREKVQEWRKQKAEKASRAEHLVRLESLKKIMVRGKLKAVIEWIENFIEGGEKLLVFAEHREVVEALAEHFQCDAIMGGMSAVAKDLAVRKFQEVPEIKLLVLNTQAGGVGLTLTAASNVAFLELPWTPTDLQQAEDRCYGRVNDLHGATTWFLVGVDTIEEWMAGMLDQKTAITNAVNKGEASDAGESILSLLEKELMKRGEARNVAPLVE